jgi:hypothetical protein
MEILNIHLALHLHSPPSTLLLPTTTAFLTITQKANLFSQLSDGYTFSSSTRFGSGSHSGSYIKAMLFSLLLLILLVLDWESERGDSGVSKVSGG